MIRNTAFLALLISVPMALSLPHITSKEEVKTEQNVQTAESAAIVFTEANFQSTISKGVTVVDFWATWCGPCLKQGPIIEELAVEYKGTVKIGKVDVDKNRPIASKYYIQSIPTIIIFKDGEVKERLVGLRTKTELTDLINRYSKAK
jgi:thioredoxin 1